MVPPRTQPKKATKRSPPRKVSAPGMSVGGQCLPGFSIRCGNRSPEGYVTVEACYRTMPAAMEDSWYRDACRRWEREIPPPASLGTEVEVILLEAERRRREAVGKSEARE